MKVLKNTNQFKSILSKTVSLRSNSFANFSKSKTTFSKNEMESMDFLESLHIPKNDVDIQKQLTTLGKFFSLLTIRIKLY